MHDFVAPTCSIQILEQGRCDGNETLKQVNSTACLTSDLKRVYTPACKSKFIIYYLCVNFTHHGSLKVVL